MLYHNRIRDSLQDKSKPSKTPTLRRNTTALLTCALGVLSLTGHTSTQAALPFTAVTSPQEQPSLAPMLEKVSPAVVNISTTSGSSYDNRLMQDPFFRHFFNLPKDPTRQRKTQSAGSGVIIDAKKGTVVTNHHVIDGADTITIHFSDGISTQARLLGSDPDVDIAVLQIEDKEILKDRPELVVGDAEKLRVGDFVVAIGNPFGLGQTVTTGIVSALGRSGLGIEGYENFIQTDASINPGNSGGALVSLNGELIGINTAIIAPSGGNVGIGFAIPTTMMKASVEQIIEHGEVRRGKIGVLIQNLTPDLAQAFNLPSSQKGVLVSQVQSGSAAADAGLLPGDIVTKIDGKPSDTASQLRNHIGIKSIGDPITVQYLRKGDVQTSTIIIGNSSGLNESRTEASPRGDTNTLKDPRLSGITFMEENGTVVVENITPLEKGAYTGLEKGDVIESINQQHIDSIAAAERAIDPSTPLLIRIGRDNQALYLAIQP